MDKALVLALDGVFHKLFAYYYHAHVAHWFVEGPAFPSYHKLFGTLYETLHAQVDVVAELMRTVGGLPPVLPPTDAVAVVSQSPRELTVFLLERNRVLAAVVSEALAACEASPEPYAAGVSNSLQGLASELGRFEYWLRSCQPDSID